MENMQRLYEAAQEREKNSFIWNLKYSNYEDLFKRTTFFETIKLMIASGLIIKRKRGEYEVIKGDA